MANPITWRNATAPDVTDVLRFSTEATTKGLSGLSSAFTNAAKNMDADQLNAALNQIQQMNQVGQAQGALENDNFIASLGLSSPEQEMAARKALGEQVTANRAGLRAGEKFEDESFLREDTAQSADVLNQIQQLNQLGQASGALTDPNFIKGLGLRTPQQEAQARAALQKQVELNRNTLGATQQFEDKSKVREDIPLLNQIDEARAVGDFETANALSDQLNFGSGKTQIALKEEKKTLDKEVADESFDASIAQGEIDRNKALEDNTVITQEVLGALPPPLKEAVTVGSDGKLVFGERVGERQKEKITGAIESLGGYSDIPEYADIRRKALADASPLVGAERIQEAQDQISGLQSNDPIYRAEAQQKLAFDTYQKNMADLDLEEVLEMNQIAKPVPIGSEKDVTDVAQKYIKLALDNDTWTEVGKGDYKQVVEASMTALDYAERILGRTVNIDSLERALAKAPEVLEAQASGGNLGDWWGDEVDPQALAQLIVDEDQDWYNRYSAARSNIRDAKTKRFEQDLGFATRQTPPI